MNKLKEIFVDNWKRILLSYLLMIISQLLLFSYPYVLGKTIDGLIIKEYHYLIMLGGVFLGFILLSYISNIYDTIVFSSIYRKLASKEVDKQINNEVDTSSITGRYHMLQSLVRFFEGDVMNIISSIIGIVGSLYIIFSINVTMGIGLLVSGIITVAISFYFSPIIGQILKEKHDIEETEVDVFTTRKMTNINNLLKRIQKLDIINSNVSAKFSASIQFVAYFTITMLLFYYIYTENVSVGSVFSTYRYLFEFCTSVATIPMIITSFINLSDILKRFE